MNFKQKKENDVIVIYLSGRLDIHISAAIEKEINEIIQKEKGCHLLAVLKDVDYMSSSALRILVSTKRVLRECNCNLKLAELNSGVMKLLEVLELVHIFDIYDTEAEGLKSFQAIAV